MGQLLLLVVAAAWAAVLLPPLLRSRVENRPNSSVSDFRNQLSRLQRAMPTRGVAVRTMGRPLAPSTLSRPAATGRPGQPASARTRGSVSSRIAAPAQRAAVRAAPMPACTRRRCASDPTATRRRRVASPGRAQRSTARSSGAGRTSCSCCCLTTVCAGFLAATTDSKAMVYVFALAMLALGGYVYLLVTMNQREAFARGYEAEYPAPQPQRTSAPARRHAEPAPRRSDYDFDDLDEYEGYDRPARQAAQARAGARPSASCRAAAGRPAGAVRRRLPGCRGVGPDLVRPPGCRPRSVRDARSWPRPRRLRLGGPGPRIEPAVPRPATVGTPRVSSRPSAAARTRRLAEPLAEVSDLRP